MISVILSWIYIFLIGTSIGIGALHLFKKRNFSLSGYLAAGIIVMSAALVSGYVMRNKIKQLWRRYRPIICSWEGLFYGAFVLLIAFFTSRGEFHTDTWIFHTFDDGFYRDVYVPVCFSRIKRFQRA